MLRSIKKAFDMVRQQDAETAVTVHTIRMWCKEGKIKCLTAGNKVLVEKLSIEFEEDVLKAYKEETTVLRSKVLTFSELMKEWQANIKANLSISYYLRAQEVGRKFNAFLVEQHLEELPNEKTYAIKTIKGYRRVLRTLFNEAVRYEWIVKTPYVLPR